MADIDLSKLPIWLINLKRANARRAKMESQLNRLGLSYQLFDAVDGEAEKDKLLNSVDHHAFRRLMGRNVMMGEIGCYHSHLRVWEALVASGQPYGLILEDDVVFHDDFIKSLQIAIENEADWDLVRFNAIRAKLPFGRKKCAPYQLTSYAGPFTGNGAYLMKATLAQKLLPAFLPIRCAHDHELNRFFEHDFRLLGLTPFSSHVDDGGVSTITGHNFATVTKFKWYHRLPYYQNKAANYFRRFWWLVRNRTA